MNSMKYFTLKTPTRKVTALTAGSVLIAGVALLLPPLSSSSAAATSLEVTTTASKTRALYTGDAVTYAVQVKNSGTEVAKITALTSTLTDLTRACQGLIGDELRPGQVVSCKQDDVRVSGLPASNFVVRTFIDSLSADQVKTTFVSTNSIDLWWYGRIPGFWKNHPEVWSTKFAPNDYLQDVFAIPEVLLSNGILDNDSLPGKDTLLSTMTYQGGVSLKGASQILLRAASAALLNEAYYGANYPGAPSAEYLIARTNVVLASLNKAQYLVLAGYLEKWNNGVRTSLEK